MRIAKLLVKECTLGFLFPLIYRYFARKPTVIGRVLFFETKERGMPDSFALLWRRLEGDPDRDPRYTTLQQNHVSPRRYFANCIHALRDFANAEVIFLADASDLLSCVSLRPETKVVQLWHACGAFKKWGMSTADLKFGNTRKQIERHPYYRNLSLVTISSPEVAWAYIEAMDLKDQKGIVKPLGVSRTDVFFDNDYLTHARKRVEKSFPASKNKRIILYAPTFRGHVGTAEGPRELDIPALRRALSDRYVLIIRHHPFVKNPVSIPAECGDFAYQAPSDFVINELLCAADVCITDYSSIVFEYSLLNRPMVFFAYDLDEYDDWRGFYYAYDEFTPGPVFQTSEAVVDYLKHVDDRFDPGIVGAFRAKFMSSCDGRATDRILNEIW